MQLLQGLDILRVFSEMGLQRIFGAGNFQSLFKITISYLMSFGINKGNVLPLVCPSDLDTLFIHQPDEVCPAYGLALTC